MAGTIYILIIVILVFFFIIERLLEYLNISKLSYSLPKQLVGIYSEEKYKTSQEYTKAKYKLATISSCVSIVGIVLLFALGGFAWLDNYIKSAFGTKLHEIPFALMFFGILALASEIIGMPAEIWSTFVIEQKFGFNKTTTKTFILDKLKTYLISIIIGGGLLSLIIFLILTFGSHFWLYAWIAVSLFSILITMFYSSVIVPLFNKQKPLEEGELRNAIEEFSKKVNFKLDNIFVIDGSKRSTKANAYFSGLGSKKRIVLYDTLINNHTIEELVAVLAHEIGHYKKKHTLWSVMLSILQTGVLLFLFSLCLNINSFAEALTTSPSVHISLLVFGLLYTPLSFILSLLMNVFSRSNEYEADRYAGTYYNSQALQDALIKLSVNNLGNLNPHWLYVFFNYSHPPLLKRLEHLRKIKK